jgi:hypothetical protein
VPTIIAPLLPECTLKLDSGETVPLKVGDTLIQNGSRHA